VMLNVSMSCVVSQKSQTGTLQRLHLRWIPHKWPPRHIYTNLHSNPIERAPKLDEGEG
jgi:hypothetical protein